MFFVYTHSVAKGSSQTKGQNKLELLLNSYLVVLRTLFKTYLRQFLSIHTLSQKVHHWQKEKISLELELNSYLIVLRALLKTYLRKFLSIHTQSQKVHHRQKDKII
jgi:hypothetical protein